MHVLLIQLFLIIFYQEVFASLFNTQCTTTCNLAGLVCVYNRCKCDPNKRLFWTGARCLACPDNWSMTETACITFNGMKMSWSNAVASCHTMQAELISLRDNTILPLIYGATSGSYRRKRLFLSPVDKTIAWTSAHALYVTNLGLYEWNDKSVNTFTSTHPWWCRINTEHLGYSYPYNEPTRRVLNQEIEKCVLLRRGKSSSPMLCLDDVFCKEDYPFICERSEATARKFAGPPPSISAGGGGGGFSTGKDPNSNNIYLLGMLSGSNNASKSGKSTITIIVIALIGFLLLLAIIGGIYCFIKHHNATGTHSNIGGGDIRRNQTSNEVRASDASGTDVSDITDDENAASHRASTDGGGLTLSSGVSPGNIGVDMTGQKKQKSKRTASSRQTFDEFD